MLNISVIFMIVAFILFCICIPSQHMLLERDILLIGKTAIAGTGYTTQNACKQRKTFFLPSGWFVFFFKLLEKNALKFMVCSIYPKLLRFFSSCAKHSTVPAFLW